MKSLPHSRHFRTDEMCWRDLNKINVLIKDVFLWLFCSAMWSGVMNWLYEDLGSGNFLLQTNGIWDIYLRKPLWAREQCSRLKDKKWDFLLTLGHQTTWIFFFLVKSNSTLREDSWESLGLQGDLTSPSWRWSVLGVHWKDWYWSWNSNTLATWWEELTHWKRPWCWEGLRAGGEGDDRGWDGWMASLTQWTWVWINSGSWWWTGRPGVLRFMGSQRVGHDWATELNWTEQHSCDD